MAFRAVLVSKSVAFLYWSERYKGNDKKARRMWQMRNLLMEWYENKKASFLG